MNIHSSRWVEVLLIAAVIVLSGRAAFGESIETDPLKRLSWLVGGSWVAKTQTADGKPAEVEVRYRWLPDRRGVVYDIVRTAEGASVHTMHGLYYWHPGRREIGLVEVNKDAGLTEAWVQVAGGRLIHENLATNAAGVSQRQRAEVARDGDSAFDFKASVLKEGQWIEAVRFRYQHKKE
ncbi:MAG: hypothetical protein AB1898_21435 [Acidobacteriota bacterium]